LSAGLAGLLISIPNLTGSLLRIPFSAMCNRDGGRLAFLILLITAAVGLAGIWGLLAFVPDRLGKLFPLLLVFGALGGAGIATFSVGISQTSFWYPQKTQGSALAAYAGIGNIAPGLFALLLGMLIPVIDLAYSYLAWLVFLLLGIAARDLPIGTAYAVWTGIGAACTFLIGVFVFHDAASLVRVLSFLLIVTGVIGLRLTV